MRYRRVLFVCAGNTCRSPMAEMLLLGRIQSMLDEAGITSENWLDKAEENPEIAELTTLVVSSRGMNVYPNASLSPNAYIILAGYGLNSHDFKPVQLEMSDITDDTLVLTMTADQANRIRCIYADNGSIYSILDYAGLSGDVEDPYGQSLDAYKKCFFKLDSLMDVILARLIE